MTDQTTTHELDDNRRQLLARLAAINACIAEYESEAEAIKAELRSLPAGDYAVNGTRALRIVPTRRFDVAKAAGLLDQAAREAALTVTWDAALVKKHLTQVEIDECMVEAGKPKVVLL